MKHKKLRMGKCAIPIPVCGKKVTSRKKFTNDDNKVTCQDCLIEMIINQLNDDLPKKQSHVDLIKKNEYLQIKRIIHHE